MRTKTIAILAVAAVLLGGVIFAIAQRAMSHRSGGHGPFGGERGLMTMMNRLDLSVEQQAKVKEILSANRSTVQPIREQLRAGQEKLAALKGSFDEEAVSAIAADQGKLMAQLIVARQRVKSEIFSVLNDEQKAKAEEMRLGMRDQFKDRMRFRRMSEPERE